MTDTVVRVRGVDKVFGAGADKTPALQQIDLEIPMGAFVSLIGPSGCGKSTLLRLIGDLTQPTAGTIEVNGKTAHRARLDRDYGMVFQAPVLFDWRTVQGNVELPLEVSAKDKAARADRAKAMLALVELIPVDLPQPRNDLTREDERYFSFITRVRERLRGRDVGRPGAAEVAAS